MFDSVLGRAQTNKSRFGTGTIVSIALHGGLLAGALWISSARTPPVDTGALDFPKVVFAKGTPNGGGPRLEARPTTQVARAQPHPARKTRAIVQPDKLDNVPKPPETPETPPAVDGPTNPEVADASDATGLDGARQGPGGGGGGDDGPIGMEGGVAHGLQVVQFGSGMTRPVQVAGTDPRYTREAREARVEGLMLVKCVITVEGLLNHCRVIKGLPYMNQEVLSSLETRRYQPVTFQGHPVAVDYLFNIRLMLPGR